MINCSCWYHFNIDIAPSSLLNSYSKNILLIFWVFYIENFSSFSDYLFFLSKTNILASFTDSEMSLIIKCTTIYFIFMQKYKKSAILIKIPIFSLVFNGLICISIIILNRSGERRHPCFAFSFTFFAGLVSTNLLLNFIQCWMFHLR